MNFEISSVQKIRRQNPIIRCRAQTKSGKKTYLTKITFQIINSFHNYVPHLILDRKYIYDRKNIFFLKIKNQLINHISNSLLLDFKLLFLQKNSQDYGFVPFLKFFFLLKGFSCSKWLFSLQKSFLFFRKIIFLKKGTVLRIGWIFLNGLRHTFKKLFIGIHFNFFFK